MAPSCPRSRQARVPRIVAIGAAFEIRRLSPVDVCLVGEIDRSERVDVEYIVSDGNLVSRPVARDVPTWDPIGAGERSVSGVIAFWEPIVAGGASLIGAFDGETLLGLAIVDVSFEPGMAWLAFLYVSRPHRRTGVASALWAECELLAGAAGATSMYVSAVPSGSAVGFYLSCGCELADPPHPDLFSMEPEDIHLVCPIG